MNHRGTEAQRFTEWTAPTLSVLFCVSVSLWYSSR